MRQSNRRWLFQAACILCAGCGQTAPTQTPASAPSTAPSSGTIVSLSPAASDLLMAMGLQDRIVGVSGYEANADLRKKLPNVGDYQRIDWERLSDLKPGFLIIQGRPDRLPGGITERCATLHITPIVLTIDRFADIESSVKQIGDAIGQAPAAAKLNASLDQQLAALHDASKTKTPALIVLNEGGNAVIGRDNFINDALEAAGGENVITASGYPSIDREKFLTLHPAAIFLLLPDATPAIIATAKQSVAPATNVFPITSTNALLPGTAVIDLARQFADHLKAVGQ